MDYVLGCLCCVSSCRILALARRLLRSIEHKVFTSHLVHARISQLATALRTYIYIAIDPFAEVDETPACVVCCRFQWVEAFCNAAKWLSGCVINSSCLYARQHETSPHNQRPSPPTIRQLRTQTMPFVRTPLIEIIKWNNKPQHPRFTRFT